jgi:hypothetical protein
MLTLLAGIVFKLAVLQIAMMLGTPIDTTDTFLLVPDDASGYEWHHYAREITTDDILRWIFNAPLYISLNPLVVDKGHVVFGYIVVTVVCFLRLAAAGIVIGPFPFGASAFLRGRRRQQDQEEDERIQTRIAFDGIVSAVVVLVGTVKACWDIYHGLVWLGRVLSERFGQAVLELED